MLNCLLYKKCLYLCLNNNSKTYIMKTKKRDFDLEISVKEALIYERQKEICEMIKDLEALKDEEYLASLKQ